MTRSKLRSPKFARKCHVPRGPKSSGRSTGKARPGTQHRCQFCKFSSPKGKLRSILRRRDLKKHTMRSPGRAALPTTVMRSKKKCLGKKQLTFKPNSGILKPKGCSRRIKLIDASPGKRPKKVAGGGGTPVLFLVKDSSNQSAKKAVKSSQSHSRRKYFGWKSSLMDHRFMAMPKSRAGEGVDFFHNLGQKVIHPKPADMPAKLRGGGGALVGGKPAGRLTTGRLEGGGLGAGVAEIDRRLTEGLKLKFSRGTEPQGTGLTGPVKMTSLRPNPVLGSGAALTARNVVVPLTNHLPIIDFISTSEFHNMYATRKHPI